MDNKNKQIDRTNLTLTQVGQLDTLNTLKDIASMFQEVIHLYDDGEKKEGEITNRFGAILIDMRDQLTALNAKEQLEIPDTSTPVVSAVSKLEKAISSAIKSINIQPVVNVDAPQVNVASTPVDLKGIEKILKTDIPNAFRDAIGAIPPPEKDDYSPLLQAWEGISQQLSSIDIATRMKPQAPNQVKVVNPDGTYVGSGVTLLPSGAATSALQLPDNHNVVVTSAPTTAVTGTFFQTTQPVSGMVSTGVNPAGTTLTAYSVRLTTNTTTTPVSSTAYISSITISSEIGGTTSTLTIQDKQGTPLKLVNGFTTVAVTTTPNVMNFQTPIKMTSGIDIITAGVAAATLDIWLNYYI